MHDLLQIEDSNGPIYTFTPTFVNSNTVVMSPGELTDEKGPSSIVSIPPMPPDTNNETDLRQSPKLLNKTTENEVKEKSPDDGFPKGRKLGVIMFALCLTVFCVALDNTIIATAIPSTDEFHALQDIGWYGSAYLLTTSAFQLFYGKLYANVSIKTVFLAALLIFEVGSVVCGTASSSQALIIGVSFWKYIQYLYC
jgi:hypothetical protein